MAAGAACGWIDDRYRADAIGVGARDEMDERRADSSPDDLHPILSQLRNQVVLLLFADLLNAHDVHADDDICRYGGAYCKTAEQNECGQNNPEFW
jgi:hypothetical protein